MTPTPKPDEPHSAEDIETLVVDVDDAVSHRVSVYITSAALKEARKSGMIRGALVIEAVERALEEEVLQGLIKLREKGVPRQGSRFPARPQSRRLTSRAFGAKTRTLWQPAFSEEEIIELDAIMEEVGAKNRSQLISIAVEWYLTPNATLGDSSIDLDS
ncbi:hypothetical protein [Nocardia sp. CNY236]|uniref:hypothetical protein n=1 Tax=Nocardia sp. CNY236 TaxID=1169152 RepID=UPI0012DC1506|nr:hypothetical protein [Nocardia sp. CNY236]